MDKFKNSKPHGLFPVDSAHAAESVRSDFSGLIEIFDRHLNSLADNDRQARRHVFEARAAAERGLRLSHELLELIKS